jgi:hypothetical protein
MSSGQIYILALVVIFLVMFAVGNIEYSLPFFQRLKFDNICNKYLSIVQTEGGLSVKNRNDLLADLEKLGLTDISINAPTKLEWNNEALLKIEGNYTFNTVKGDLSKGDNTKRLVYENKTRVMTLER